MRRMRRAVYGNVFAESTFIEAAPYWACAPRAGIVLTLLAQHGNDLALDENVSRKSVIQHRVTRGA